MQHISEELEALSRSVADILTDVENLSDQEKHVRQLLILSINAAKQSIYVARQITTVVGSINTLEADVTTGVEGRGIG